MARRIKRKTISGSIGIHDVQEVLDTSDNSLDKLCTHNNINKWAKYKPERSAPFTSDLILAGKPLYPYYVPLDDLTRRSHNYGLDVPYCENCLMNEKINNIVIGEETGWDYLKPRGNRVNAEQSPAAEFYRLSDFSGYDHDAEIPFTVILLEGLTGVTCTNNHIEVNSNDATEVTFEIIDNENRNSSNLHINNFIDFSSNGTGDNDICWRPVIQIFDGYVSADDGFLEWYLKTPFKLFSGNPIPEQSEWYISLNDMPNFSFSDFERVNNTTEPWHICIGLGCCKKGEGNSIWDGGSGNKRLFLPPYTEQQNALKNYPFYYTMLVFNHPAYDFRVTDVYWYNANIPSGDHGAGTGDYNFAVSKNARNLYVTLRLTPLDYLNFVTASIQDGEDTYNGNTYKTYKVRFMNRNTGAVYDLTPVSNIEHGARLTTSLGLRISGDIGYITAVVDNFDFYNVNSGETVNFNIQTKKYGQSDYNFSGLCNIKKL